MIRIEEVRVVADRYKDAPVECDGMTRIFHHYFLREGIEHTVWVGIIRDRLTGDFFSPHFWICCETDEGRAIVDYRNRMCIGSGVSGVFLQKKHPELVYEGVCVDLPDESEQVIQALLAPFDEMIQQLLAKYNISAPVMGVWKKDDRASV